ncbi:MAG: hypothetical protein CMF22_10325 [Idiomarinaceae bacterium]|nr:hypothetical protein [Idiomarinaceae bacterium]MBG23836.1 hypothetical protein [Idiomarinaceae bacterium]|tara:strand:+ start:27238 stop:27450 length:213 start_codon:yes stop_codon:yes gene_type:complete
MAISKANARSLAVQYQMFSELDLVNDRAGKIWLVASDLLNIQQKTGVELHSTNWLESIVQHYYKKMNAEK